MTYPNIAATIQMHAKEMPMENKNICKFSISRSSDLICTNFIFETQCSQQHISKSQFHLIGLTVHGSSCLHIGSMIPS